VLSIVIGTFNRLDLLRQCLSALIGKVSVKHEIIVVDAGSTDGTLDFLGNKKGVKLVMNGKKLGQARSLNQVFNNLQSQYTCWLSDDNVVREGMLDLAVSILTQDSEIGMVSLKVKDVRGPYAELSYLGGIWPSGIINCNQGMIPTKLLLSLGGFDEKFRDYGIDADLTTKVLLAGYKVVFTKQIAIHHYRDHEASSWMGTKGRRQRLDAARALYGKKYENLIQSNHGSLYNKTKRQKSLFLRGVRGLYGFAGKTGIPLGKWIGLEERDWQNLIVGRFVSPVDFLINIHKPYYLVQKITDALRKNE